MTDDKSNRRRSHTLSALTSSSSKSSTKISRSSDSSRRQQQQQRKQQEKQLFNQENLNSGSLFRMSEDEDDSVGLPSQVDAPGGEVRKKYCDLIQSCQQYRDKGEIEKNLGVKVKKNIDEGKALFTRIGDGPGDVYLAFLHAQTASGMILAKTEHIGSFCTGFTVDGFLKALTDKGRDRESNEYSSERLIHALHDDAGSLQTPCPDSVIFIGAFDREALGAPSKDKEKRQRAARKKNFDSDEEGGTHVQVDLTAAERAKSEKGGPEAKAKELLGILEEHSQSGSKPKAMNLLEFTLDPDSIESYFENLFHVSFLVRDGYVSIARKKRRTADEQQPSLDTDLVIETETPPPNESGAGGQDSSTRNQLIMSFNAATFKALQESSAGTALIKKSQTLTPE